ncbi:MAG: serine hydroxymethyltransferase [Thaumarchaeota archaeon]|nr:serine hydroxymethyltransferase [Nitrososphaerota archaeon]MCL5318304.1 serine hydroxymethyltransferase [Nitrososphaerota archaeon]
MFALQKHQKWFSESIPLIASENAPSPAVREAMVSDFMNRYAEGWPGERVYAGCTYIDQVELQCIELAKKLFRAEFADVRPISGVTANLAVYSAISEPGDRMVALAIPNGGHISVGKKEFSGTAGLVHGLRVEYFPFNKEEMNIDVDETKKKITKMVEEEKDAPKFVVFGGSLFLFPHPIKQLADFLKSYGITVCYDAAHVAGLIAGNQFQDPLREGAEIMMMSTHKTLFGPQGGAILAAEKFSESIKKAVFPGVTSNHHLHSVAGKAIAFTEMMKFGQEYATQVVRNAKALGQALHDRDLSVMAENKGFTESHQIVIDITKYGLGGDVEKKLEKCNIILNRQLIPGDTKAGRHYMNPGGLRIGVSEVTRIGMKQQEMEEIAEFIRRVVVKKEDLKSVANDVVELRRRFQKVQYCFEPGDAYQYIKIR